MLGLMQDWPLLCHRIIDHAALNHGGRQVISRSVEGPIHTTNYIEVRARALRVAQRLERDGIKQGDRVATLAWNTWRHLEAWYGIMGMGAVYHTINPRLFAEQIVWIVNHAEDRMMMVDLTFMPILEKLADKLKPIEKYIVLTDAAHMPATPLKNAVPYEEWIAEADGDYAWKIFDENTAAGMCYTSGTTGHPKGVLYSHRSNVLHSMMAAQPDAMGVASCDAVLPVVPMFHANCWGLALTTPMVGATLVLPGGKLDGASIYELLDTYRVTFTAAVPTVWLMLLQHLEANDLKLPYLKKVVIGGSACPRAMTQKFQDNYGVEVCHAWGMTEMSPLGTLGSLKPEYAGLTGDARLDVQMKQGHPPFGVEMKITDDSDRELPRDGTTFGRLKVRGPSIARAYFKETGQLLPITWDFSHFAIVKHLQPSDFSGRLLERPDLVTRASQFHFRPFNGHHCQVPVTDRKGSLTRELRDWLPFVADTLSLWNDTNRGTEREIFVVPEMGPASSGYNLDGLPNSWEEAVKLRPILENLWRTMSPVG